jgi:hypothetical protein
MNENNQSISDNTELETIEISHWADLLTKLERLEKNPDYKAIVEGWYLQEKVLDSVGLLAAPQTKQGGHRPDVMEDLVAASNFKYAMFMIHQLGEGARAELMELDGPGE